ncbi:MAG TPA: GMC family oxidoreductase, partial [Gemmatimonadaceae bacterium]|nr:GMC family oxidoreductase [Gemmatimonadaceae bacterium]
GGFDYEPRMQDLYRGESVGLPYYPLQAARLHYFGGTTGHWAGFCSLLDPLDFEGRDWVPHSGWPITRTDLEPYYRRAQTVLQLGPNEWSAWEWQRRDPTLVSFPLDSSVAFTKMWQFSAPTRFGNVYRDPIVRAPDVHLYTHANVVEIETNEAGTSVTGLRTRSLGAEGREHRVRAAQYVLACSTIQNARLLLASNRTVRGGVGNGNDLVGRYFMEHLEMPSGLLATLGRTPPSTRMYEWKLGTKARGELALSAEMQRTHRILNATVSLTPAALNEQAKSTFQWMTPNVLDQMRSGRDVSDDAQAPARDLVPRTFHLLTRQEQAPNPASRISLSSERDALGMPRARLDWRLTELDRRSFRAFYEVLGRELGRAGVGRLQMRDWVLEPPSASWPASLGGGWHHMGTTRMSRDPKQGVVDVNCQVHGVANLYVAGAAVYPTAGCVNPTLTLVAMSLRLSDHLRRARS